MIITAPNITVKKTTPVAKKEIYCISSQLSSKHILQRQVFNSHNIPSVVTYVQELYNINNTVHQKNKIHLYNPHRKDLGMSMLIMQVVMPETIVFITFMIGYVNLNPY